MNGGELSTREFTVPTERWGRVVDLWVERVERWDLDRFGAGAERLGFARRKVRPQFAQGLRIQWKSGWGEER